WLGFARLASPRLAAGTDPAERVLLPDQTWVRRSPTGDLAGHVDCASKTQCLFARICQSLSRWSLSRSRTGCTATIVLPDPGFLNRRRCCRAYARARVEGMPAGRARPQPKRAAPAPQPRVPR